MPTIGDFIIGAKVALSDVREGRPGQPFDIVCANVPRCGGPLMKLYVRTCVNTCPMFVRVDPSADRQLVEAEAKSSTIPGISYLAGCVLAQVFNLLELNARSILSADPSCIEHRRNSTRDPMLQAQLESACRQVANPHRCITVGLREATQATIVW